jgi:hypothetical protein
MCKMNALFFHEMLETIDQMIVHIETSGSNWPSFIVFYFLLVLVNAVSPQGCLGGFTKYSFLMIFHNITYTLFLVLHKKSCNI